MPELPEVETVARDLRTAVLGRMVLGVTLLRPSVVRHPAPERFVDELTGTRFAAITRRGKFIDCALQRDGATAGDLILHLGMTGHLDVRLPAERPRPHTHLSMTLDDAHELRYADARRFGRVLLGPRAELEALGVLPRLGVEPLSAEFTAAALDAVLRHTTRTVKAALLDQRGVAGLGNIYVDEICFAAGVRPTRRCHRLTRAQRQALHGAIVTVLGAAIANRGSSIDDYRDLWDAQGTHQEVLRVYGRAGLGCLRCGSLLRRTLVAGRGTTYCSVCQR